MVSFAAHLGRAPKVVLAQQFLTDLGQMGDEGEKQSAAGNGHFFIDAGVQDALKHKPSPEYG